MEHKILNPNISATPSSHDQSQLRIHAPGIDSETGQPLDKKLKEHFGSHNKPQQPTPVCSKALSKSPQKSASKNKDIGGIMDLKFSAQNVRGFGNESKRKSIFLRIKERGDILFFQETHTTLKNETDYRKSSSDTFIFAHGKSNSRGVMIVISEKIEHEILKEICDPEGRYIIVSCLLQGYTFLLVNAYAPNKEKEHAVFLTELRQKMELITSGEDFDFILGEGDWNFTENNKLDRHGGNPKIWKESCAEMGLIRDKFDLIDIYRTRNEEKKDYTYRNLSMG